MKHLFVSSLRETFFHGFIFYTEAIIIFFTMILLTGCKNETEKAIDQARKDSSHKYAEFADNYTKFILYKGNAVHYDIPACVKTIGEKAFEGNDLQSVTIPDSVISIGKQAFHECGQLRSVTIPNSVTVIGHGAFGHCYSLSNIAIPNSVTSIERNAFYYCTNLQSITIPSSITVINDQTFLDCKRLETIAIPNSVVFIGNAAFAGCSALQSVTIPNSVVFIGNDAFVECSALQRIIIPQRFRDKLYNLGIPYNCMVEFY